MRLHIIKDDSGAEYVQEAAFDAGFQPDEIVIINNDQEAREWLDKEIPDIAVVDPHLTNDNNLEDGIELIVELREHSRDCIIICLTAQGTNSLSVRALVSGANCHIDMSWPYINWKELMKNILIQNRGLVLARQREQE